MNLKNDVLKGRFLAVFRVLLRATLVLCLFISACSDTDEQSKDRVGDVLTIYKTPSCGCCNDWVTHLQGSGFNVELVNQDSVAHIKDFYGIPKNARSCHTAVSDSGLVFEGHVPAKWIKHYLANEVKGTKGLVVPAMPVGSPGMEFKDQFQVYDVFVLTDAGEIEPFVRVKSYEEQF